MLAPRIRGMRNVRDLCLLMLAGMPGIFADVLVRPHHWWYWPLFSATPLIVAGEVIRWRRKRAASSR